MAEFNSFHVRWCEIKPGFCELAEHAEKCDDFKCLHTKEKIEAQMYEDVKNPRLCGQREPKIAMLMWVLQNTSSSPGGLDPVADTAPETVNWLKRLWKRVANWRRK